MRAAAAETHFNKPLDKPAAGGGIPARAAEGHHPSTHSSSPMRRRLGVIGASIDDRGSRLTVAQPEAAKAEPIVPSEFRRPQPIPGADWTAEDVRRQLIAQFGADVQRRAG